MAVITFERWYPFTSWGYAYSGQQTNDGGYIITGKREVHQPGLLLMKTDSLGDTLWTRLYIGVGYSVKQTTDGGYIVAGTKKFSANNQDILLLKTDENGDSLWAGTYGGNDMEYGYNVIETSDNGFIIVGCTWSFGSGQYDVYMIKTSSMGDTLWTRVKGGGAWDVGWSIQETLDGGYIIAGETYSYGAGGCDFYLIKTDSMGSTIWQTTYGGSGEDRPRSIKQTNDGGYIIAGGTYSFGAGFDDVYLVKTDSMGNEIWAESYGGFEHDAGYSIALNSSNEYVVAGYTESYGIGAQDVFIIKTDSLGNTVWQKTFGSNLNERAYEIERTQDEGYIITGIKHRPPSPTSYQYWYLIKTDSLGDVAGIEEQKDQRHKTRDIKLSASPNPFTSLVSVKCSGISEKQEASLEIYDISGRLVKRLRRSEVPNSQFLILNYTWDGRDNEGKKVNAGIYFLKLDGKPVGKVVKVR